MIQSKQAAALLTLSTLAILSLTGNLPAMGTIGGGGEGVPFQFQAGQPARADEINQNFDELVSRMMAMQADMQAQIDTLQSQLAAVEDTTRFFSISEGEVNGLLGPHLFIEGVNVHVRSGTGTTRDGGSPLGVGNIVIGYNEEPSILAAAERVGSHNLILGEGHRYMSTGGIVAGMENSISGLFASVLGGTNNRATGETSTVTGGDFNQANGKSSSVSGGVSNIVTALRSSASGGAQNTVSGIAASISGGSGGAAGGFASSISGGQSGIASGDQAAICGGQSNSAFGSKSVVSGGFNINVNDDFIWAACDLSCN